VIAPAALAWAALGGSAGALLRLLISSWFASPEPRFPWATLFINIAGSLGIGLLWGLGQQQPWFEQWGRYLLVTGFLGGFTTFSAFSFETMALVDGGRYLAALVYVLASVTVCIIAAWAGLRFAGY
jgi:CrcB protein